MLFDLMINCVHYVDQLVDGIEVMTTAHILQAPVRIVDILTIHNDYGIFGILEYDLSNGISFEIQSFPQIMG